MMRLAMYKGKGEFFDSVVRLRTGSVYSHCELVLDGRAYSSSIRDQGVRSKIINFNPASWDIFKVVDPSKSEKMLALFAGTEGQPYDWKGILIGQAFGTRAQSDGKAYCSEWCGAVFGLVQPSPGSLCTQLLETGEIIRL